MITCDVLAADEFGHLVEAGQAGAAHELLVRDLAPALFCSRQPAPLQKLLDQLAPHENAVRASGFPVPWQIGAGLYTAHLSLQVDKFQDQIVYVIMCRK